MEFTPCLTFTVNFICVTKVTIIIVIINYSVTNQKNILTRNKGVAPVWCRLPFISDH